jgi:hypothetical protein
MCCISEEITLVFKNQNTLAGPDNETLPSAIRYRAGLNISIRAQKGHLQQFGPITSMVKRNR